MQACNGRPAAEESLPTNARGGALLSSYVPVMKPARRRLDEILACADDSMSAFGASLRGGDPGSFWETRIPPCSNESVAWLCTRPLKMVRSSPVAGCRAPGDCKPGLNTKACIGLRCNDCDERLHLKLLLQGPSGAFLPVWQPCPLGEVTEGTVKQSRAVEVAKVCLGLQHATSVLVLLDARPTLLSC